MAADIRLKAYRGVATILSTGLDSLVATTGKVISAALDNSSELDLFADFEMVVDYASAPTANTVIELYVLPSVDGTNYPDGSSSVVPAPALYVGGFVVRNDAAVQRIALRGISLPPGLFKVLIQNTANQAFATGNTLKYNKYAMQTV